MKPEQKMIDALEQKLNAALYDLYSLSSSIGESCLYCKHYHECEHDNCDCYDCYCLDKPFGDCKKLVNTPCNGCDFRNHWEWRGVPEDGAE